MNIEKLQETAKKIAHLEEQCQNGVDVKFNMKEMYDLMSSLDIDEMIALAALMENIDLQS